MYGSTVKKEKKKNPLRQSQTSDIKSQLLEFKKKKKKKKTSCTAHSFEKPLYFPLLK